MKLAVLMVVHGSPHGLARVVDKLNHSNVTFFVHVDAKSDIDPFKRELASADNVRFLTGKERHEVNWGGRSQVDAIISLANVAYSAQDHFDRFLSLSGQDYPVCTPEALLSTLSRSKVELVRIDRFITPQNDNKLTPLSLHDIRWLNPRNYVGLARSQRKYALGALRQLRVRRFPKNLRVVHGSAFHCLTRRAVACVLRRHISRNSFYESLRFSFSADEFYIHTLLYNCGFEFSQNYVDGQHRGGNLHGLHYIDWGADVKAPPKLISLEDIEQIANTDGVFFVRKVDLLDSPLLSRLDEIY